MSLVAGCATSVPVQCPNGFELTDDKMDCVPVAVDDPDAGPVDDPPTCETLDCDDGNECTVDGCADALCTNEALKDGSLCAYREGAGLCLAGKCVADCSKQDCRPVYPCTEQGIRHAIRDGGDVIIGCEIPTTVTLTEGMLEIDKDLSLDGLGNLTIDADQKSRVLRIYEPAVVKLIDLGITGGLSPPDENVNWRNGGGIRAEPNTELTILRCHIFGNASIRHGGGISTSGTTTIIESEITENTCNDRGGAITNSRNLTILDSVIARNHSQNDGGGIYNTTENGRVTLERSVVTENIADDAAGGIFTTGQLVELKSSSVTDNRAGGSAGGIWVRYELRASDCVIARNVANAEGGGIKNRFGLLTLERTLVSHNASLDSRGGGIYNEGDSIIEIFDSVLSDNAAQHGGAVYSVAATARLVRSAVINNTATHYGGGFRIYQRGPGKYDLSLENCTIAGNEAGEVGGAITSASSVLMHLAHTTMIGNEAPVGPAIQQDRETTTELAYSVIHGRCDASEDSPLSSLGFNAVLDLGAETCMLTGSDTDQILSDEQMSLGPLSYNGGPTPTHQPNPGSLLIDAIPPESCDPAILEDQPGEPRGGASPCDIGAVEVQPTD